MESCSAQLHLSTTSSKRRQGSTGISIQNQFGLAPTPGGLQTRSSSPGAATTSFASHWCLG